MTALGTSALGTSPYGLGTPDVTAPLGGYPLTGSDGVRQSVRKIDLYTRQYTYDATGRAVGDSAVRQQMQLVATTDLGSCAVLAMGNTIKSIKDVTPDVVQRIRSVYTTAYARMVARGLVTLGTITVEIFPATASAGARALTRIPYTDLTTGQDEELVL